MLYGIDDSEGDGGSVLRKAHIRLNPETLYCKIMATGQFRA